MTATYVREHLKPPGWECPDNNLLQLYFASCERHGVVANTDVARQIFQRVRSKQPLPWHLLQSKPLDAKLETVFRRLDFADVGAVSGKLVAEVINLVSPSQDAEECEAAARARATEVFGLEDFSSTVSAAFNGVPEDQVHHALLEILIKEPLFRDMDPETKFMALFRLLDTDENGYLDAFELRQFNQLAHPKRPFADACKALNEMDINLDGQLTREEFVKGAVKLGEGLSDYALTSLVQKLMFDMRLRKHGYNLCYTYIGPKGLQPLLDVVQADPTTTTLDLRNCGIRNEGCKLLQNALSEHPGIETIYLDNNYVSDEGGLALTALLTANPNISTLTIKGIHLLRPHSHTHRAAGPSPCEDATKIYEALEANRALVQADLFEVIDKIRSHGPDLKALFTELMDRDGECTVGDLTSGLQRLAQEWSIAADDVAAVMQPARSLTGGYHQRLDVTGSAKVSWGGFMLMLRPESVMKRASAAIKHQLLPVKAVFWGMRAEDGTVDWHEFKRALLAHVDDPGNGWGVTSHDVADVLADSGLFELIEAPREGVGPSDGAGRPERVEEESDAPSAAGGPPLSPSLGDADSGNDTGIEGSAETINNSVVPDIKIEGSDLPTSQTESSEGAQESADPLHMSLRQLSPEDGKSRPARRVTWPAFITGVLTCLNR